MTVFHDQHNHPRINNLLLEEIHHIQINVISQCTVHEYHLINNYNKNKKNYIITLLKCYFNYHKIINLNMSEDFPLII